MLFESQIHDLKRFLPWVEARNAQKNLRIVTEQRRRLYPEDKSKEESAQVVACIEQLPQFRQAQTVLLYYPIHNELDLRPLLERYADSKTLLLPVTHRKSITVHPYHGPESLEMGHLHIMGPNTEPYTGKIDLILVPGVVFDAEGHRIGRGGGYYDRYLRSQRHALKLGVGYDFQLKHTTLPHTWRDVRLDGLLTPSQTIIL